MNSNASHRNSGLLIVTQKVDLDDQEMGFASDWYATFARHYPVVSIICLQEGRHELPENVRVHSLGKERGYSRARYLWRLVRYSIALRREYGHVFVHMNPIYVVLMGLPWRTMGKRVALWYATGNVDAKLHLARLLANQVFTSTPEGFRIETPKRIVVGQGIDTERFKPAEAVPGEPVEPFTAVTVGRLTRSKGIHVLIEAFTRFAEGEDVHLRIAGSPVTERDHVYAEKVRAQAEGNPVEFVGLVRNADVPDFLRSADAFVNVGLTGSLDKAVLEAMAAGTPILSCNDAVCALIRERWPEHCVSKDAEGVRSGLEYLHGLNVAERQAIGRAMSAFVRERFSTQGLIERIVEHLSHA